MPHPYAVSLQFHLMLSSEAFKDNIRTRNSFDFGAVKIVAIALLIVCPLFFQLAGKGYHSDIPMWDSGGHLMQLPLPVSLLTLIGLPWVVINGNGLRKTIWFYVLGMLAMMGISLFFAASPVHIEARNVLLMAQVMLPVSGLFLGSLMGGRERLVAKGFMYFLLVFVPCQLLSGWSKGVPVLTHDMFFFSVYQHFQYVPLIFVCAYFFSLVCLWKEHAWSMMALTAFMGMYVTESLSLLTLIAYGGALILFCGTQIRNKPFPATLLLGCALGLCSALATHQMQVDSHLTIDPRMYGGDQYSGKFGKLANGEMPSNLAERLADWKHYGTAIIESPVTLFFGHPAQMPREVRTSPHNWYIDMAFNFGLMALLPICGLMGYTGFLLWKNRANMSMTTLWLAGVVVYLVAVDSNFKVTLREPYPGIFAYFMWGMLLAVVKHEKPSEGIGPVRETIRLPV